MNPPLRLACLLAAVVAANVPHLRADWPQWMGPARDGHATVGEGVLPAWREGGPEVLWRKNVGIGCSSAAVAGGRLYTLGNEDDQDQVLCLDAASGEPVWQHRYAAPRSANMFEGGPTSTPLVMDGMVYTVSRQGLVHALRAADGSVVWTRHLQKDFGGREPGWGYSGSPLLHGSALIFESGAGEGSVVALDCTSGKLLWKGGRGPAGYASPVVHEGVLYVFGGREIQALDPADGRVRWALPWKTDYDINAATPLMKGPQLFLASGYGTGSALLEIVGDNPREVWRSKEFGNQISNSVRVGGQLYGSRAHHNSRTREHAFMCLDWDSGATRWEEASLGMAQVVVAGSRLVLLTQGGELALLEANPDACRILGRMKVFDIRSWAMPAYAAGVVFVRDNEGNLAAIRLAAG